MNTRKPRVILHIGQHKTGTKALQSFMAANSHLLRQHGVLYAVEKNPRHNITAYINSHFHCYVLARHDALIASGNQAAANEFWSSHHQYCSSYVTLDEALDALEAERIKCSAHTILISSEDLFDMNSAHEIEFLEQSLSGAARAFYAAATRLHWNIEIAVYLRRPDHLLNAHYAQYIKGSVANTIDFATFYRDFSPRLDSLNILTIWSSVFGDDRIHVRPYERESLSEGITKDFIEHFLGFTAELRWTQVPVNLESSNFTPNRTCIELLREINIRMNKQLPCPSREAILHSAFIHHTTNEISANWLLPAQRYDLLSNYHSDYRTIASRYCNIKDGEFFKQAWPKSVDDLPKIDTTLYPEEIIELMQNVLEYEQKERLRQLFKASVKVLIAAAICISFVAIGLWLN